MPKKTIDIKPYFIPKEYYAPCMYAFEVMCITKSLYKGVEASYLKFRKVPNSNVKRNMIRKHLVRWIQSS